MDIVEKEIIDKINLCIKTVKDIAERDKALSSCMMFFLKQSLDLYEAVAAKKPFSIEEITSYVTAHTTTKSPEYYEALTSFLTDSAKGTQYEASDKDLEVYQEKVNNLRKLMQEK